MNIRHGAGKTEYGPGVEIQLNTYDIVTAIEAYLVSHGINYTGPRTIRVNGDSVTGGSVYVDPSGFVMFGGRRINGNGTIDE